jgi:hypothetical protein
MVTIENYEEYLMMAADGELDAASAAALRLFLAEHRELAPEVADWEAMKLTPDETIVFDDKPSLMRRESKHIAIYLKPLAMAAGIAALLIAIPFLWKDNRHPAEVAHVSHVFTPVPPVIKHAAPTPPAIAAKPAEAARQLHEKNRINNTRTPRVVVPKEDIIVSVDPVSIKPMEHPGIARPQLSQVVEVAYTREAEHDLHEPRALQVRVADANRPVFDLLKQGIEVRIAQAGDVARTIKETALVVKIGSNKLHVNF